MVLPFSKIALGMFGLLGTGGLGLAGTYQFTKSTVLDGLEKNRLVDFEGSKSSGAWTKLVAKLPQTESGSSNPTPKTEKFVAVKNIGNGNNENKISELKKACKETSQTTYYTIFFKDENLLNDVKNFCTITIKEMLGESVLFNTSTDSTNQDKTTIVSKVNSLKSYEETTNGKMVEGLEKIKNALPKDSDSTASDDNWKSLVRWCDDSYKSYFFNEDEAFWKQINVYCKKNG